MRVRLGRYTPKVRVRALSRWLIRRLAPHQIVFLPLKNNNTTNNPQAQCQADREAVFKWRQHHRVLLGAGSFQGRFHVLFVPALVTPSFRSSSPFFGALPLSTAFQQVFQTAMGQGSRAQLWLQSLMSGRNWKSSVTRTKTAAVYKAR